MNIVNKISEWSSLGIKFWREDEQLRCSAPVGVLTADIKSELKLRKVEILDALIRSEKRVDAFHDTPIPKAQDALNYQLSPPQRRYIDQHTLEAQRTWSTIILQAPLKFDCDGALFRKAFDIVCERHDCLRTVFSLIDGERRQEIKQTPVIEFEHCSFSKDESLLLENRIKEILATASVFNWDCEQGPLGKLFLVTGHDPQLNKLILTCHRVVMDGASMKLMLAELMQVVSGLVSGGVRPLQSNHVRYRDFSEWLNDLERSGSFLESGEYWGRELLAPLPDPFGFNQAGIPEHVSKDGAMAIVKVPIETIDKLRAYASREGCLFPMLLFSIYAVSLWEAGGGDDLIVDTPLSGRSRSELKESIGFFTNAVPLRVKFSPEMLFSELINQTTRKFFLAEEHQYFQYDAIVDGFGLDRNRVLFPLSGLMFTVIEIDNMTSSEMSGHRKPWSPVASETAWGSMFYSMVHSDCMSLELKHRLAILDKETAIKIVETYARIIHKLADTETDLSIAKLVLC